jgi:hypothetical protein
MNIFSATINPGIGDILLCRNMLDSIKHQYDAIILSQNESIVKGFREVYEKSYYNFCLLFTKEVFSIPPYKIVENSSLPRFSPIDNSFRGLPLTNEAIFKMNDYSGLLCNNNYDININEPYIVVTMKVRGTPTFDAYNKKYKEKIINLISNLSDKCKVVILGERTPPVNPENKMIGPNRVFCLYNDIPKKDSILDMTLDGKQTAIPDINTLKRDCTIMNRAKCVITLGIGGNMILSSMVSKKSINFLEDVNYCGYYVGMVNQQQREGITITNNFQNFIQKCNEL